MLLLHICCGPCAIYPVTSLQSKNIDFKGFFYNPNIHPKEEHLKRMENVKVFKEHMNVDVYFDNEFKQDVWENFSGSGDERCLMCYSLRLEKTAQFAKENGFAKYSTTLLVSPYQNHELIKELGVGFGKKHGVEFYYEDFRPGFRQGQNMAKEMGLYR